MELSMKENGKIIRNMVKEPRNMQVELFMKETGKIIRDMEKEP